MCSVCVCVCVCVCGHTATFPMPNSPPLSPLLHPHFFSSAVMSQDMAFFDQRQTGEVVNRLTSDVQEFKVRAEENGGEHGRLYLCLCEKTQETRDAPLQCIKKWWWWWWWWCFRFSLTGGCFCMTELVQASCERWAEEHHAGCGQPCLHVPRVAHPHRLPHCGCPRCHPRRHHSWYVRSTVHCT